MFHKAFKSLENLEIIIPLVIHPIYYYPIIPTKPICFLDLFGFRIRIRTTTKHNDNRKLFCVPKTCLSNIMFSEIIIQQQ